jgi:hypothetical protein
LQPKVKGHPVCPARSKGKRKEKKTPTPFDELYDVKCRGYMFVSIQQKRICNRGSHAV